LIRTCRDPSGSHKTIKSGLTRIGRETLGNLLVNGDDNRKIGPTIS
jgi:hypothetical protein